MRPLWIGALFCGGGIFASAAVIWTVLESAPVASESRASSMDDIHYPQSLVGLSQYPNLWKSSGAMPALPADLGKTEKLWTEAVQSSHLSGSTKKAQLRDAAQSNAAVLSSLLQKFEKEQDPNLRQLLKSILFGIQKPEILAFSLRLTESSNPLHRIEGFELLSQLSVGSRQLRQAAMSALASENDPMVLRHVITALNPKVATPLEVAEVSKKLHHLARHADVEVRKQSIEMLIQWDNTARMESLIEQALADPAVRYAAINALNDSRLRTDNIKLALLDIIRGDEDYTRHYALYVLGKFNLTQEESEFYKQVRAELVR